MPNQIKHEWRSIATDPRHTIYRRPLGNTELGFYWDSVFFGTAITINHVEVDADPDLERDLFTELNVVGAWLRMKQRYPLLGASIDEVADSDVVEFVVNEESLHTCRQEEICLTEVDNVSGISEIVERLLNGSPPLSNEYLARLWVTRQKDIAHRYHVFIILMHSINDGVAGCTAEREFLQELSSLSKASRVPVPSLAKRLTMLLPIEDLGPRPTISPARHKWREATAKLILSHRQAKQLGGHTLPCRPGRNFAEPAYSRTMRLALPEGTSERILASCRALSITFGSVLPVLSQVAIARVLHRRRSRPSESGRSLIDDKEWAYRCVQPMHFGGPVNFRPYLNREWFKQGGASELCIAITFSYATLPFMPMRDLAVQPKRNGSNSGDAPSFSSLLSPARFVYRARLFQAQTERQLRHPLFYEIHNAQTPRRVALMKATAIAWRARQARHEAVSVDVPSTFNHHQCVFTNGGASLGNRDALVPQDYPIFGNTHGKHNVRPRLHVVNTTLHLRCRPSELYLGAVMERKQLIFFTFVDLKTYDEDVVREWMEEIRNAAIHYLGDANEPSSRL